MEYALLQLLSIINAFDMATENPILAYRFNVNPVERCPMNASEFETAAKRKNCTGNYRYLCAPDGNLSNLTEFCTDTKKSLFEKGNCLRLEGTGDLNHYRCVERFDSGCPTEPYTDDEIYKYPACLELNIDFKCFVADKDCQVRLSTTTEQDLNDSKNKDAIKKAKPETYDGPIKLQIVIVIVFGFLFIAFVIGSVAIYLYKKEKCQEEKVVIEKKSLNKCNGHTKENDTENPQNNNDPKSEVKVKKGKQFKSLSGCTKTCFCLEGFITIGDLRDALSDNLHIPRSLILAVDKENGIMFEDDIVINTLKHSPIELMIGNQNRMKDDDDEDDDESEDPACLELNKDFKCFVADKDCHVRLSTTTEQDLNDSKNKDAIKKAKPETYDESIELQIVIVIVFGFLSVAIRIGSVAIDLSQKEKCLKENGTEKKQNNNDQKSDVKEEKMEQCRSLSGCTKTCCCCKGVNTISDLRDALSNTLHISRSIILVVDEENGIIFKDDTVIDTLKHPPRKLMIGNQHRMKDDDDVDDDEFVESGVFLNRPITSGKCRMSGRHFTSSDSLYEWTKEKLHCGTEKGLLCSPCCPLCLEIDKLFETFKKGYYALSAVLGALE